MIHAGKTQKETSSKLGTLKPPPICWKVHLQQQLASQTARYTRNQRNHQFETDLQKATLDSLQPSAHNTVVCDGCSSSYAWLDTYSHAADAGSHSDDLDS